MKEKSSTFPRWRDDDGSDNTPWQKVARGRFKSTSQDAKCTRRGKGQGARKRTSEEEAILATVPPLTRLEENLYEENGIQWFLVAIEEG